MASQFFTQEVREEESVKKRSLGAGIRFCSECRNMMVPKEPKERSLDQPLQYHCAHCNRYEDAVDPRIYVNILKRSTEESYLAKRSVSGDPALERRIRECPQCQKDTVCVVFLAPSLAGEEKFQRLLECTECHHQWGDTETVS